MYISRTPPIVKRYYKDLQWQYKNHERAVYLTFDDGPTPEVTPWVLDQLKAYDAKATFFCLGKNVKEHPEIYQRILDEGHAVGNHTFSHLKGWKTKDRMYLRDVLRCSKYVKSSLFRPPYGKISRSQIKALKTHFQIVMWSVLSRDYDPKVSNEKCLSICLKHMDEGSIIVFHDSKKAQSNMMYALEKLLPTLRSEGYQCLPIPAS